MYVCPECGLAFSTPGVCSTHSTQQLAHSADPLLGQLIGSYRIACMVGEGGMGRVYKAVHPQIGSRVAIKVLSAECSGNRSLVERFFGEARAVNVIRHESIVNVLDIATLPDGRPYIIMEYLDGEPLSALTKRGGVPLRQLLSIGLDVLRGLGIAHEKGIVHRDLKSDNVFITREGRAKILDFGIAKLVPEMGGVQEGTRTGALLGTPHYMSPEQALARPVDARSDLYSVGVILYEAATGRRPFHGSTLYELLKQHIETPPPPPRSFRPDLPPSLEHLVLRALEKNPLQRFQSAEEFARALEQAQLSDISAPSGSYSGHAVPAHTPHSSGQQVPLHTPSGSVPQHTPISLPYAPPTQPAQYAPSAQAAYGPPPAPISHPRYSAPQAQGAAVTPGPFVPPEPPKERSMWPLALGIGCGGLLIVGALGAGLVALGIVGTGKQGLASRGSSPTGVNTNVVVPPTATRSVDPEPDFNAKRFEPAAFLGQAEARAKRHYPDAVMVAIDIVGMNREGIVDFTSQAQNSVIYRFRSAAHSVAPPDFPSNAVFESNCMVYVMVMSTGINSFVVDRWACDAPLLGKPRCDPLQIWKKAEDRGGPKGNVVGSIGYGVDDKNKARWYVIIPPNFSALIPDDC